MLAGEAKAGRLDPEAVIQAAAAAGLVMIGREPQINEFQFLLVFGKPAQARVSR